MIHFSAEARVSKESIYRQQHSDKQRRFLSSAYKGSISCRNYFWHQELKLTSRGEERGDCFNRAQQKRIPENMNGKRSVIALTKKNHLKKKKSSI